jgi:hypothetical protein
LAAIALFVVLIGIHPSLAQTQDGVPDLVITGITLSPEFPEANQIVEVTVGVQNIGRGTAAASRLILRVNEQIWASQSTPEIMPQTSSSITFAWVAAKGRQVLKAHVNAFDDISELNLSNNTFERVVEFTPDLVIESVELTPKNPQPGEMASVSIIVRNVGGQPTDENATVHFKMGRAILRSFSINPLGAGERAQLSTRWLPVSGEHIVRFEVDALEMISESNELNNAVSGIINISSNPPTGANLSVQTLEIVPARPQPGQQVTVRARVSNEGSGFAQAFTVKFEVDGQLLATRVVHALAPGESTIVLTTWIAVSGERVLRAKADLNGVIIETNESDNVDSTLVYVGMPANDCAQTVYLELDPEAVPLVAGALGLSEDSVMSVFLPKIKNFIEQDYEGINLAITLNAPNRGHSRIRLLAESRFAILGSAPLDMNNRNHGDIGSVFLGSFIQMGGRGLQRFSIDEIAQSVANTASHELGHLLGLTHNEVNDFAGSGLNLMTRFFYR